MTASDMPQKDLDHAEIKMAWRLVAVVLVTLLLVKPLGGIAYVGAIAFTIAAGLQLYLPIWRMDTLGRHYDFLGLHTEHLRADLILTAKLCALTFGPYALGYHIFVTQGHDWVQGFGFSEIASYIPQRAWAPKLPADFEGWLSSSWWLLSLSATHFLGVALPEETFYRGYLQPRLEKLWPPQVTVFGVLFGKAAIIVSLLFALGHFLGEWNPMRLGPFFPSLIFAWQRNATGSIYGAISYHALCNIFGALLFTLYGPA